MASARFHARSALRTRSCRSRATVGVTVGGSRLAATIARGASRAACRTGRSAPRGRPRSAARRARRPGPSRIMSQIAAWAPTSMPRVGCEAISTFGSARHLAPDDQLLLVAARQRERAARRCRACARRSSRMISSVRSTAPRLVDPRCRRRTARCAGGRAARSPTAGTAAPCRRSGGPRGCSRGRRCAGRRVDCRA